MERIEQWYYRIDTVTSKFQTTFGNWEESQLNHRPSGGGWSVAEILQHLIILNSSYFPLIEKLHAGTLELPWTARFPSITKRFGKMIYKSVLPETKRKAKTMSVWEPHRSEIPPGILDRFVSHQQKLKETIASSESLVRQHAIISSPANRFIVYPIDMLFDILVAHEERHLAQAEAIA